LFSKCSFRLLGESESSGTKTLFVVKQTIWFFINIVTGFALGWFVFVCLSLSCTASPLNWKV